MDHHRKIRLILGSCMVLIAVFSAYILYKTFRPSKGLPYEKLTMEQAAEYMSFEDGYLLIDVRPEEEFNEGHLPGAVCIPLDTLGAAIGSVLRDRDQMIYVYGKTRKQSAKAARHLCKQEFTNIAEIGSIKDWSGELEKGSGD